jgi:PEP-CTERM motif
MPELREFTAAKSLTRAPLRGRALLTCTAAFPLPAAKGTAMAPRHGFKPSHLAASCGAAVLALAAAPAHAALIVDPAGDFLPTYTGPQGGDLDVLTAEPILKGTQLTLTATLNGAVGTSAGGVYVWGVNRGGGVPIFQSNTPPIGAGVLFDSVVVLNTDGTGAVVLIFPTLVQTLLPPGSVTIDGNTITGVLDITAFLPNNGTTFANYGYNLWPRNGLDVPNSGQVADFAPDASTVPATIPEPATWAMMIAGFGLIGLMARRRHAHLLARA